MAWPIEIDHGALTRRQKVLFLLITFRLEFGRRILHDHALPDQRVWISGGYHGVYDFVGKSAGGSAGYQRLWELREMHRIPIVKKLHKYPGGETWIWRLEMDPAEIYDYDWAPAFEQPFRGAWTKDGWTKDEIAKKSPDVTPVPQEKPKKVTTTAAPEKTPPAHDFKPGDYVNILSGWPREVTDKKAPDEKISGRVVFKTVGDKYMVKLNSPYHRFAMVFFPEQLYNDASLRNSD